MKKLLFFFAVLLPLHLLAQTTYYVSNSGSDSNSGTSESSPWESLTKVNSQTFSAGDQILFKRGDQWEGTITVSASGSSGNPIVYGAYGSGDNPKIYGSEEITGWTLYSGNIYQASLSDTISQLFLDDERMQVARYPNSGYFLINTVINTDSFSCESLNTAIDYTGAVWIGRTSAWSLIPENVTASSSDTISLASSPVYDLNESEGFYLTNKLEFLDSPGEWYYDTSTETIYFWTPDGSSPANYQIRGAVYENGLEIYNKSYISIQNIDITQSVEYGIYAKYCPYLILDGNNISNPDGTGIFVAGGNSTNVQIINNSVTGANHYGVLSYISHSTVSDNQVDNTAMHGGLGLTGISYNSGNGIEIRGDSNIIRYNRIINSGYHGLRFYGVNTQVEYNYIDGACLTIDDGGGIYTWSGDINSAGASGSVVRYNIVLNVTGNRDGRSLPDRLKGYGIYMDDNTHDILIEHNTVAHSGGANIFLHGNGDMVVKNNTLIDAQYGLLIVQDQGGTRNISNNIIYAFDKSILGNEIEKMVRWRSGSTAATDSNTYINHYNSEDIFSIELVNYDFETWKTATGQDSLSTCDTTAFSIGKSEELFYNDTKVPQTFDLGNYVYTDIYGEEISGELTLEPFTSQIVIEEKGTEGNTEIFANSVSMSDRRAMPFTFNESGEITSISIYHEGSTGDILMAIYSDNDGYPSSLLGVTPITEADSTSGWQTISLTNRVNVSTGEQVWLAWIFEDTTTVRYKTGSPGRAWSTTGWSEGMPANFGSSSIADYIYSIYCNYAPTKTETAGYTEIYNLNISSANRRAVPVTFDEAGEIESISMYHNGGSGDVLLAVYSDLDSTVSNLLGVTDNTAINDSSGWQTIRLIEPVTVNSGETIWLAWVFENNPGIRYSVGGSLRAHSNDTWSEGMPEAFGNASYANAQYSIYCNYIPIKTKIAGYTEIYNLNISSANRRAVPVTFDEAGEIESISMYHNGGSGDVLLAVYSDLDSTVSNLLGVTDNTAINDSSGWQTIRLIEPVTVNSGETVWLAWVFENNPGIRYSVGGSLRAHSNDTWSEGMPEAFGNASYANAQYSIYCNYIKSLTKSATISPSYEPTTIAANNLTQFSTEEITINEGESYLSWTEPGTYQRVLTAYSGADSIVTTILTVAPAVLVSEIDKHDTPNLEVDEKSSVIAEYFKVYPNPANTYVNIECEAVPNIQTKLIIMNSSGETLLYKIVESTLTRMDISHLPAGIYFVRMVNGKNDMSKKLIVTNKKR